MLRHDESFGIVPFCRVKDRWEVFLIKHRHGKYWGFPKGHAEERETPRQAAARELKEETSLDVQRFLSEDPLVEHYQFWHGKTRIHKKVLYFMAEVAGDVLLQNNEIIDGLWLSLALAMEKITHKEGKAILTQAEAKLPTL